MAGKTPRFGFSYFGAGTPGTINDGGQKYTSLDRLLLDRLLASVEQHDHKLRSPEEELAEAPTGTLLATGGELDGGFSYFYRFAVLDAEGSESLASPEVEVETPTPLAPPGMPAPSAMEVTTGSLAPGFYYYAVTAHRGQEESTISGAAVVTLTVPGAQVLVELPDYGDADSFSVWRMGSTEPGFTRIATVAAPTATFEDAGTVPADPCACDPGVAPPAYNTGVSNYAITVTLPESVDLTEATGWRLYRSVTAGIYEAQSLVHEVVEREGEWDDASPLLRSWTDVGNVLTPGKPMDTDQNMRFRAFTFDSAEALPDPTSYPANYPILVDGILHAKVAGVWKAIGGGGGGGESGGEGGASGMSPIMTSSDGSRFILSVANDGSLVTTPTTFPGPPAPPTSVTVI